MTLPLVSIIIPTYNQASYISRAVKSALDQVYPNLEIIIADDHSSENILIQIQELLDDPRIKYFKNNSNIGRVKNYRKSIEEYAIGDWVLVLDGDDYLTDNSFIADAIKLIIEDENVVFVQAGHTVLGKDIVPYSSLPDIKQDYCIISGNEYFLNFKNRFSHLATLYKRSLAVNINFYRFNILSSDIESILRLSLLGKVILLKKTVGVWYQHSSNATRNPSSFTHKKNILLYQYCSDFAKKKGINKSVSNDWHIKNLQVYILNEVKKSWQKEKKLNRKQLSLSLKLLIVLFKRYHLKFLSIPLMLKLLKIFLKNFLFK